MDQKTKWASWLKSIFNFSGPYKCTMILSTVLAVCSVLFSFLPYYAVSKIILSFIAGNFSVRFSLDMSILAFVGYFLHRLLFSIATLTSHKTAFSVLQNIRSAIAEKLIRMPMGSVQEKSSGQYKDILVDEVERIEFPIAHMLPEFTSNLIMPIAVFIYMLIIDWRLALISLIPVSLGLLGFRLMMSNYEEKFGKYMQAITDLNNTIIEYINGIQVIKAFGQSTSSYKKYSDSVENYRNYTLDWYHRSWKYNSAIYSVMPSVLLTVLPLGAWLLAQGRLEIPIYVLSMILSLGLVPPLIKIVEFMDNFAIVEGVIGNVNELLSSEELSEPEHPETPAGSDIEFSNVSFSYDETEVLHGISFSAHEGDITAIVGPSGSGKSTIAKLILRLWDTSSGEVKLGGVNIRNIALPTLLDSISYVSQDNYLFNISIKENIRIGRPNASDDEVIEAAKKACCHDEILRLSNAYDTLAGDCGGQLSGGERQRITIARAILRDAPVVILDEATAYIDVENEDKIHASISALTKGKTLIVIAHRIATVQNADQIIVLNNGNIDSVGTHQQLLERSELYRNMWNAQAEALTWSVGKEAAK